MGNRMFLAVKLSAEAREIVRTIGQEWRMHLRSNARWVNSNNVHVTLHFLGNVSPAFADKLPELLRETVGEIAAAPVTLGELGAFPHPHRATIIYVSIQDSLNCVLQMLHRRLKEQLTAQGVPLAARTWQPHLTLARLYQPHVVDIAWHHPQPLSWLVDRVSLMNSTLTPAGPAYTTVAVARLREA